MNATASPSPFSADDSFTITVTGGTPPYTIEAKPSPPNPPGVVVDEGPPIRVTVPPDTPSGTRVQVVVTDSSTPPAQAVASARVA